MPRIFPSLLTCVDHVSSVFPFLLLPILALLKDLDLFTISDPDLHKCNISTDQLTSYRIREP